MPESANSQFLSEVSRASASCRIVAGSDIYDQYGAKLWARHQPVSQSLQQKLLDRKLKAPLEACLLAEDGVTTVHLYEHLTLLLDSAHALAPVILPYQRELLDHVRSLPLHPAAQLLLTIAHTNRPAAFAHAIEGMALAGAMALHGGYDRVRTRLAMLGGLLHDIGEMYIDPDYLEAGRPLDAEMFRYLATHPLLGAELIRSLMDYPPALWQGIAQHHERLCGTGYPAMCADKEVGELGRLLAVVDTTIGATHAADAPLQRASLALRMVPGEYDPVWVGLIARAAASVPIAAFMAYDGAEIEQARSSAQATIDRIRASQQRCVQLASDAGSSDMVRKISDRAAQLLARLDVAYRSSGISFAYPAETAEEMLEQLTVARELAVRLEKIRTESLWSTPGRTAMDEEKLVPVWQAMA
nr:HD domain-containing phosphohydrolase [Duganella qianjiadongensis]